jgi:catechol 2,3-dioxygenase-like lactoylglutathione lyase family enzyme
MSMREFFHLMQIVDDFDDAEARYKALLGMDIFGPKHWSDFDKRWASLGTVGREFVFEIMEPSKDEADFGSPLPKFRNRHGQHLHSLSWYYDNDEIGAFAERLTAAGIRVIDPYPDTEDFAGRTKTIFTHPKDSFGQMEFQGIVVGGDSESRMKAAHLDPDWTGEWWRDEFPLGLIGVSHITTIVDDMDRARSFWSELLEGVIFHEETGPDRSSCFVAVSTTIPGREIVVELAQPTDPDSLIGQDQAGHGNIPHAMNLRVKDLDAARAHVEGIGFNIIENSDEAFLIDPADLANGVVYCTTRPLPNDPRGWING